jgi:tetratricopeptide (TPR) repeat protein
VLEAQCNLAGALEVFRKSLAIAERLSLQDPYNAVWQRNLSVSYNRIGGVLEAQGDLDGALEEFRKSLAIDERLALQDPDNARWQSGLSVGYNRFGGVLEAQGDLDGALKGFLKSLTIRERLAVEYPDNAEWQRNAAVGQASVARAELALGRADIASALYARACLALQALRNPDIPGTEFDWASVTALGVEIALAEGNTRRAASLSDELAGIELDPQSLVGPFRIRSLPLILKHLYAALQSGDLRHGARSTLRALRLGAREPTIDLSPWRERARELRQKLAPDDPLALELSEFL